MNKEIKDVCFRNAKKSKDKINQMQTDLEETERNITRLSEQKRTLTIENKELQQKLDEITEEINEGSGEFSGIKKEIASLQEKENKLKGERLDADNNVSKMEKSVEDAASKIPLWEKEV
ncbi:hypothetical protein RR48_00492 [Papilio machaon]|uniref:Uncharacterized protein n=1 Tax=Papilio machaon TaxID=76193 RepID=A0A0N1IQY2_PAPMA|nr:hypothetical protein RR48_00492 [Papilio machaon]